MAGAMGMFGSGQGGDGRGGGGEGGGDHPCGKGAKGGHGARSEGQEGGGGRWWELGARLLDHREAIPPPLSGNLPRHRRCRCSRAPRCKKGPSSKVAVTK